MHIARLVVPMAFLLAAGCADGRRGCDPVGPSLSVSDSTPSDWRAEAQSLLATAPGDSVVYIGVVLHPQAKAAFRAWDEASPDVTITYEFLTISAFSVRMPVRALAEMVQLEGIEWIEWNRSWDIQLC